MDNNNNNEIKQTLLIGLDTLSSDDIKVPASSIDGLAAFKGLLRTLLKGELVISTPERVLPDGVERPNKEINDE